MSSQQAYPHLLGKRVVVGISGGIAAYKSVELVRLFRKNGAEVQVLLTPDATRFVTPLTLGTLSERQVHIEIFPPNEDGSWTRHVHLGLWADILVVAPATANTISKLVAGTCDSMLTAVALSARCPTLVCPAMDHDMYEHASTQANMATLRARGVEVMDSVEGLLASGLTGMGRLPEPHEIVERTIKRLSAERPHSGGPTVLITAGPTVESLDPVRFLSNRSSGTMGYELARAAVRLGCSVTLVSGPTALETPDGVRRIDVKSAEDMYQAVMGQADAQIIIMAAAVADYTPDKVATDKIKKGDGDLVLHLKRTRDILRTLGEHRKPGQTLIGFALETKDGRASALKKLASKNADWIVLNNPTEEGAGFGPGTNKVTLFSREGRVEPLPVMSKADVALAILDTALPKTVEVD
jgi:phosphopantothenoylcysteine decarboxylase / phosphopantothenate---cysteine ligase